MTITREVQALLDRYEEKIRDLERRLKAGSDFTPGAKKILDAVMVRRQAEAMARARKALEPLLELSRKINAELDAGMAFDEIRDFPWWRGWVCIQEDLETVMDHLEAK